jgi:diacylglycerol kinase family enzyme
MNAAHKKVLVLANPRAGASSSRADVADLMHGLESADLEASVCWDREELGKHVAEAGEELRCVVAAGGDGTLLEVMNRAPGAPVALLPLGTENLVARYFGAPRCGRSIASLIAAGRQRRLDLGRINGRPFCVMVGAGIDAAVVHDLHEHRNGHIHHFSYAGPLMRALWSYPFPPIDVEVLDTGERLRGATALIFNLPRYALGLPVARGAQADDGLLDLYLFERPGRLRLASYFVAAALGLHTRLHDVKHRQARRFRLSSPSKVPLQIDGDPGPALPVEVEVVPGALTLLVP